MCDLAKLNKMHRYLMEHKFPYHSVSVAFTDIGYELIFDGKIKHYVSSEIKKHASFNDFKISYTNETL